MALTVTVTSFTAVILIATKLNRISAQRLLWPIGEYDMSMYDAAELCHQIDIDKTGTDTSTAEDYLPAIGHCFFFQWIYCPNVPERAESPCGWWEQKPCNITEQRVGHDTLKKANPYGVDPLDTIFEESSEEGSAKSSDQNPDDDPDSTKNDGDSSGEGPKVAVSPKRMSLRRKGGGNGGSGKIVSQKGRVGGPEVGTRRRSSKFSRPHSQASSSDNRKAGSAGFTSLSKYKQVG